MDKKTKRILLFIGLLFLGLFWGPIGILVGIALILIFG